MIFSLPRLRGFNFVSRRGAEEAEAAEIYMLEDLRPSALSASSAPLRETFCAGGLIVNQVQYDDRSKGVHL